MDMWIIHRLVFAGSSYWLLCIIIIRPASRSDLTPLYPLLTSAFAPGVCARQHSRPHQVSQHFHYF